MLYVSSIFKCEYIAKLLTENQNINVGGNFPLQYDVNTNNKWTANSNWTYNQNKMITYV